MRKANKKRLIPGKLAPTGKGKNKASLKRPFVRCLDQMKTALYARVSTRDKGQDTENQLVQLRAFCKQQGWEISGEYVDRATGKNSDRPEFKRMFEDARLHKFELVFFWSLDRFSREGARETLNHLDRLKGYKVDFRSFTEHYLDSLGVFGEAILSILATLAKQERIRLSERTHAGLAVARSKGRVGGRPRVIVNRDKVLELHSSGMSLQKIADQLKVNKNTVWRTVKEAA